jgi:hypothetical protein
MTPFDCIDEDEQEQLMLSHMPYCGTASAGSTGTGTGSAGMGQGVPTANLFSMIASTFSSAPETPGMKMYSAVIDIYSIYLHIYTSIHLYIYTSIHQYKIHTYTHISIRACLHVGVHAIMQQYGQTAKRDSDDDDDAYDHLDQTSHYDFKVVMAKNSPRRVHVHTNKMDGNGIEKGDGADAKGPVSTDGVLDSAPTVASDFFTGFFMGSGSASGNPSRLENVESALPKPTTSPVSSPRMPEIINPNELMPSPRIDYRKQIDGTRGASASAELIDFSHSSSGRDDVKSEKECVSENGTHDGDDVVKSDQGENGRDGGEATQAGNGCTQS